MQCTEWQGEICVLAWRLLDVCTIAAGGNDNSDKWLVERVERPLRKQVERKWKLVVFGTIAAGWLAALPQLPAA